MELKEIKDTIFELTHLKDEEGNDVPHFCFATDISTDTEETEEEILKRSKFWWKKSNEWTSDEREEFTQLPQIELLVDKSDQVQLFKDLFTILFGYIYDAMIDDDNKIVYTIQIAGQCPALIYNYKEEDIIGLVKTYK